MRFIKPSKILSAARHKLHHPLVFLCILSHMHSEVCSQSVDTVISPAAVKAETASAWILIKQHHLTGFKLLSKAYFKCRCFAGQRVIIPIIQMTQRRPFHISWPFCFVAVPNASVHFSSSATQRALILFSFSMLPFFPLPERPKVSVLQTDLQQSRSLAIN